MARPRDRRSPPIAPDPPTLDPARPYKPLDFGNGIVAGTIGADGRLLSLGLAHPDHGRVLVTTAPRFDETARRDPAAVRRYRAALGGRARAGFGLELGEPLAHDLLEGAIPRIRFANAELTAFAPAGRRGAVLLIRGAADPSLSGELRLGRAEYTQLTEGGPLPLPSSSPAASEDEGGRWIEDAALGAAAAIAVMPSRGGVTIGFGIGRDRAEATVEARSLGGSAEALLAAELAARAASPWADAPAPVRRAMSYALDCASCDVGGAVAILADHEILPLVWTRDAYYVARMLLSVAPGDECVRAAVTGFLRWCFERAVRPGGWWPRSSLASGQAKDRAFQLDQQLYPPLLLAEHARLTGDDALLRRYGAEAERVLDAVLARAEDGLVATAETPADDPLAEPFHFSSHLLLWHTLRAYGREAEPLRARIRERFTHEGRFAYAVGAGARHYHDANDVPTALAPAWGFCAADDPVWLATIEHAWSGRNEGHFPGPLGGLGSLHTRHPWPLGDLQRAIVARARGDARAEAAAWDRLRRVETWDGLLPEAYDERDGSVASRHWFSWPVALRAWLRADPALGAAGDRW